MPRAATGSGKFFAAALAAGVAGQTARAQVPTLLTRPPATNVVAAPRSGPVSLTFSQAITASPAANLRGKRPGTLSGGGPTTLSFAASQGFAPGERVSVTVPNTLTNTIGTRASKQVYQFTAAIGGPGRGFFLDTTEVAWRVSRDQLLGDIDHDGAPDLAFTTGNVQGLDIYLNHGIFGVPFLPTAAPPNTGGRRARCCALPISTPTATSTWLRARLPIPARSYRCASTGARA